MRKNSNAYKIYTAFVDGRVFHVDHAAETISTSSYKAVNGGSIIAALKGLDKLKEEGLARLVEFGPRGGRQSATWQIIKQTEE